MADDNQVEIRFSASTDDALKGIDNLHDRLLKLGAPVADLKGILAQLKMAFTAATPAGMVSEAAKAFGELGNKAAGTALQMRNIGAEIGLLHQGLAQYKTVLDAQASQYQITQDQKFAALEEATQKEYETELTLLQNEASLGNLSVKQWDGVLIKIAALKQKHSTDMLRLDEQAIAQQRQMWSSALGSIETAFNSQLRGLLAGTTTFKEAWKKMLGDMVIKFIEMCEQVLVRWVSLEAAKTTATISGNAARTASDQAAGFSSALADLGTVMKSIFGFAGETAAAVSANVAPLVGPAAPAIGAAAGASVLATAEGYMSQFDLGTDFILRGGVAMVHQGETIVPAAKGSGPFTGTGMGATTHHHYNINVSAIDRASVAQFFSDNKSALFKALREGTRHGHAFAR